MHAPIELTALLFRETVYVRTYTVYVGGPFLGWWACARYPCSFALYLSPSLTLILSLLISRIWIYIFFRASESVDRVNLSEACEESWLRVGRECDGGRRGGGRLYLGGSDVYGSAERMRIVEMWLRVTEPFLRPSLFRFDCARAPTFSGPVVVRVYYTRARLFYSWMRVEVQVLHSVYFRRFTQVWQFLYWEMLIFSISQYKFIIVFFGA